MWDGQPPLWQRGAVIGTGAFSTVYLGLDLKYGELLAVKEVILAGTLTSVSSQLNALIQEISLMRRLQHPNIVQYYGVEKTKNSLRIFMEYVPGGSIVSLMGKFGPLQECLIQVYAKQLLNGVAYLHRHRIAHRDVKCANILIRSDGRIKLSDFGASRQIADILSASNGLHSLRGSPYWMAPEVIKQMGSGLPADIWSIGCTILEMAIGRPPWSDGANVTQYSVMGRIADGDDIPALPEEFSAACRDFVTLCLQRDPKKRPRIADLLTHRFVADVEEWKDVDAVDSDDLIYEEEETSLPSDAGLAASSPDAKESSLCPPGRSAAVAPPAGDSQVPSASSRPAPSDDVLRASLLGDGAVGGVPEISLSPPLEHSGSASKEDVLVYVQRKSIDDPANLMDDEMRRTWQSLSQSHKESDERCTNTVGDHADSSSSPRPPAPLAARDVSSLEKDGSHAP